MTHADNEKWDAITLKLAQDRNALLKAAKRLQRVCSAVAFNAAAHVDETLEFGRARHALNQAIKQAEQPVQP